MWLRMIMKQLSNKICVDTQGTSRHSHEVRHSTVPCSLPRAATDRNSFPPQVHCVRRGGA